MLKVLGIDKNTILKETEKYTGKKRVGITEATQPKERSTFAFAELSASDAESFFNKAG